MVDLTNLQRQIVHDMTTVGLPKVESVQRRVRLINPDVKLLPLPEKLAGQPLLDAVAAADVVLDCSDRFATRHEVNRACVALGKPLVSGGRASGRPAGCV